MCQSHEKQDDRPIAVANCDEAVARAILGGNCKEPLRMFFLELPSGWLWLRVEAASLEYLYSLKLSPSAASVAMAPDGLTASEEYKSSQVLNLVADPALLESFAASQDDLVYWRNAWSSEVDRRGWTPLSQWLETRFQGH